MTGDPDYFTAGMTDLLTTNLSKMKALRVIASSSVKEYQDRNLPLGDIAVLTGGTVIQAAKDDIVWVPRGTVHHIRNVGEGLSLRLAVAMPPAAHYYSPCEQCGYDDDGPREWCA
jgi:hypothetical protein